MSHDETAVTCFRDQQGHRTRHAGTSSTGTWLYVHMQVEIWSDVVCPWCAIGKRRFEKALAQFAHRDGVEVRWRSYELDPEAPRERVGDLTEHLASKYGITPEQAEKAHAQMTQTAAVEGWDFHFEHAKGG